MENKEEYIEYATASYKHQLDIWYKAYNISREKIDLFHDFIVSLYDLVNETYLGEDVLSNEEDQRNHFNWCWDRTIENFEKEKILFKNRGDHYNYFWNFFYEAFYFSHTESRNKKIIEYFNILFNFKLQKSRSELDILTELYKLFNQNLKK